MSRDRRDVLTAGDAEFFEMSLDHLCVAGFDGYWKRLNSSWTRTLGWTREEMMAVPIIEFVHPDDAHAVMTARSGLFEGVPLRTLVNRYRRKDGTYCWFEWRSVSDPKRELVYAVARDLSDQRRAQEMQEALQRQLMVADRLASVGTLAGGVAHEINNPLAIVSANLDLLGEELRVAGAVSPEWAAMVRDAREGAERIRKIVRGLMTFSRARDEQRAVIAIRPVLELAIELASNEIRHRARLFTDLDAAPTVLADESRLGQVFIHLLVNAAQALPDGSSDHHDIRITTSTDDRGRAVIEIADTGPGIAPELLERIFDPFFTTKPVGVGTGLGLSICHGIVTGMGGEITAANRAGGGAVFRVALPGMIRPAAAAPATARDVRADARRASVLVVDDEPSVGLSLQRLLRGHDVTSVTSGAEALALVRAGRPFDVILSDLMMPEVSGMELFEEIRRHKPDLAARIVFMTGGAFTEAAATFLDRVPNERLEKPFSTSAVRAIIARLA
jgi:PAS domain S-box-containing protein